MTRFEDFDLLDSPLEGTNLIEASAGTGKTYAIAGLFLRLILEKDLSVDEILVVTFTVPATDELRDRIRTRLREAMEGFSGVWMEDAFLNDLVKRHKDPEGALRSLAEALRAFDQAAIFTIHGFCMRMLHENAFESGSLFDTELVTDQENLKREIIDDFWRKHFYHASPLFVSYAIHRGFSPEGLLSLLANRDAQPYLKIIPQVQIPDSSLQEKEFQECFNEVRNTWRSARTEVEGILTSDEGLNRGRYRHANVPVWIQGMDDMMAWGVRSPVLFQGFEKFTSGELQRSVKKDRTPPCHPFFELCQRFWEKQGELERVFDRRLLGLKVELFNYAHDELARRKGEKNIQFFDDLLLRLHRALEEEGGEALVRAMRTKFQAALIDEFQDTDPIQYGIFRRVFGSGNSILFLIGDPKQAIYGFRGADVFAYMDAARDVESRYTLGENWRSHPDLIAAISAIFARADRPFVYDEIPFQPAAPAKGKDPEFFRMDGQNQSPLQLWFLDAGKVGGPGKAVTKTLARELIPGAVADEISRLISLGRDNRALIGETPLGEGDIAVLVRTNSEAGLMQEALSSRGIPSVLYTTESLFDSHEALEMERVLAGISEPNNERLLKGAMATDMMGVRGEELDGLMGDETGGEEWLLKFKGYHDLWEKHGFIQMFRYLVFEKKVLTRLMAFPDGERRTTNVLHLSEVLHGASTERRLGMAGLLKWLTEQRDSTAPRLEEHQLRLESDENAVKVVTIHKSKGLEYPVVFCPFMWGGSRIEKKKDSFAFHDELDNMRLTLDLGSEGMDENRVFAEKEQLAENLRLLYVALTRAKGRCYLVWGRFKDAGTSAPAYIFHQRRLPERGNVVDATEQRFMGLSDGELISELRVIPDNSGETISLSEMPMAAGERYSPLPGEEVTLTSRRFSRTIDRQWRVSSFSSLVSGQAHGVELADRDAIRLPVERDFEGLVIQEEPSGMFSFPRGTKTGTFLHDLFEHLDFAEKDTAPMKSLVADKLSEYGFEPTWQETLCHMIQNVLSVPLDPGRRDFTLSRIRNQDRLNELEFYFPLKSISPKKLESIFAKYAGPELPMGFPERIERLDFAPVRGFMKGFVDMVFQFQDRFYLVDWKSNFLGSSPEDYGQEALVKAMKDELYMLQYHLYTVALDQHLRLRLPGYTYETHFGGIYYIFLRGVAPDRGTDLGIYRGRPSGEFINELCMNLIDQTGMAKS